MNEIRPETIRHDRVYIGSGSLLTVLKKEGGDTLFSPQKNDGRDRENKREYDGTNYTDDAIRQRKLWTHVHVHAPKEYHTVGWHE